MAWTLYDGQGMFILRDRFKELQNLGYAIPDYPEEASSKEEKLIQTKYNTRIFGICNKSYSRIVKLFYYI